MKRILLFLLTNLAVVIVFGFVLNILYTVLGIQDHRSIAGLLLLAVVFGFAGSFVSLFASKWIAKRSTGAVVIEQPRTQTEQWLMQTVERQAKVVGIAMPEVAIFPSPEMNAFATGASKNKALVAVSEGLLQNMDRGEVEAVVGHEMSHVANGDMLTLTLIQGVVNTFVIFLARLIGGVINNFLSDEEEGGHGLAYFAIVMVLEIIFGILASTIVMWFSRQREFKADEGGAHLAGKEKMIAALERLNRGAEPQMEGQLAAFAINGKRSVAELFMSHPPIEKRIQALRDYKM